MSDSLRLYLVSAAAALLLAPSTPVYWDSWGYVRQAIAGDVGGLGLGRPVFVLISQAIARAWLGAGGSVWHVEPVLRIFWAAIACAAAPLAWRLALLCGASPRAAQLAGLAVACSPAMAHVTGTLLTDAPVAALLLGSFVCGARAVLEPRDARQAALAGAALGLAFGVREQAALGVVGLAAMLLAAQRDRRAGIGLTMALTAAATAIAPIIFVLLTEPGYLDTVRGWFDGMARDRAQRTFRWGDAALLIGWLLSLGPAVVVATALAIASSRSPAGARRTVLPAIVLASVVQFVAVAGLPGMAYSPRFLVAGFAGALAIPGALVLDRWAGRSSARLGIVLAAIVAPLLIAAPIVHARAAPMTATLGALPPMLFALPDRAAIVTGYPCPAIDVVREQIAHDRGAAAAPDWQPVCPGWAWPVDLTAHLDAAASAGRPIVIDLRPTSWIGAEQRAALREATAYARQRPVVIWE